MPNAFFDLLLRWVCVLACEFCIFEFYRLRQHGPLYGRQSRRGHQRPAGHAARDGACPTRQLLTGLPDEVAPDGCGWNQLFDLLLSRILTVCVSYLVAWAGAFCFQWGGGDQGHPNPPPRKTTQVAGGQDPPPQQVGGRRNCQGVQRVELGRQRWPARTSSPSYVQLKNGNFCSN